jgi:hypothetical protein
LPTVGDWLLSFNQPGGFDAMREKTYGTMQLVSTCASAESGEELVIDTIHGGHVAARCARPARCSSARRTQSMRTAGRCAVATEPVMVSMRGPKTPIVGRNVRKLTEPEFRALERIVR